MKGAVKVKTWEWLVNSQLKSFGVMIMLFLLPLCLRADHIWYVNSLDLIETSPGVYRIDYTFTINNATVKRFYWELFVVESGCNASDGFTRSFSGCTIQNNLPFGDYTGTLASDILLCDGKSYDAVLYTRRRGDCYSDNTGGSGGPNPASCGTGCGDMSCGCPEDRANVATPRGLLTQWPNVAGGDPGNIWSGSPLDELGDTPTYDGNWAYIRTTLAGNGLPDYDFQVDITVNDCLGDYDQSFFANQDDGQMIVQDFGGTTAFVKCGDDLAVSYTASNTCGSDYPGNTFEVIDNSTLGGAGIGSADIAGPSGPGINVDGRFENLSGASAFSNVCQDGRIDLTLINSSCSAEDVTNVQVVYDIEVTYPTSNFATPTRVNCSDMCGQELVIAGANQWNSTGLNMGSSTTLEPTDPGEFSFDWSGQICAPSITPVSCDEGSGSVMVDNCASCGIYDITYAITNDSCSTCNTTTTQQVQIISPVITNVQADFTDCGEITPVLSFDVVECNPANGAATSTAYSGPGDKLWERSDNPGVYLAENAIGTVAPGETVTFTPHFRYSGCESCNAVGSPVTIESLGELVVTCPSTTDLGDFDCSNLNTIPAPPTSEATAEAATYGIVIGDDPCGVIVVMSTDDGTPDACIQTTQTITRTVLIFDDENMNGTLDAMEQSETCVFTFDILPAFVSPSLIGQPGDITVACDDPVTPTTLSYTNGLTADCLSDGSVTSTLTAHPGQCGGTITETWTIPTGENCDRGPLTFTRTITVSPAPAPIISCPADITVSMDGSCSPDLSAVGMATATGDCGAMITITFVDTPDLTACGGTGTITRTWTATNECGLSSTCDQLITVIDDTDPVITCPADITVSMTAGCVPDTMGIALAKAMDNCSMGADLSVSYVDDLSGLTGCSGTGVIVRTFTATDECGNAVSCSQNITVVDDTDPVITCPADITVSMDAMCMPDLSGIGMPTATDNCTASPVITFSDVEALTGCSGTGMITRTWTVTDDCGNTASCTQVITVIDDTDPVIVCPADITVNMDAGCVPNLSAVGMAIASDNCTTSPILTFADVEDLSSCGGTGTITRTWTATDDCGNTTTCDQIITVVDNTIPTIFVDEPAITVLCDEEPPLPTVTIDDNCPGVMVELRVDTVKTICPGDLELTRTWIVTDACGNQDSAKQQISIFDNNGPTLVSGPADLLLSCMDPIPEETTPMFSDNCTEFEIMFTEVKTSFIFEGPCEDHYLRTWTATDSCGNMTSVEQLIRVIDDVPPVLTCPPTVTVSMTAGCIPDTIGLAPATAVDDCGLAVELTYRDDLTAMTDCGGTGTIMRTWIGTDACGNVDSCTQNIIVIDDTDPVVTPPAATTVYVDASCSPDLSMVGMATGTDNCSMPTITFVDDNSGLTACGGTGTIIRTWTATDACGNTMSDTQTLTVLDTISPMITCPADVTVAMTAACVPDTVGLPVATATDNCNDIASITYTDDLSGLTACGGTGTIARTWTATDACGNTDQCVQMITVIDDIPPMITCPADVTVAMTAACIPDTVGLPAATATDNCSGVSISFVDTPQLTGCGGTGSVTRTWTATDACGNMSSCMQIITVIDDIDPVITCPADMTVYMDATCAPDLSMVPMATATDNCSSPTITFVDDMSGLTDCGGTGMITRTWTATDACGNTDVCQQILTVEDTISPVITCPADMTVYMDATCTPDLSVVPMATATDNCSSPTVTFVDDESGLTACGGTGTITRTWTATDACGNTDVCQQILTVEDTISPVITCPADMTVYMDASCTPDLSVVPMATGMDNCGAPTITFVDVADLTACGGTGVITRTWTATDACGNTDECIQLLTVVDTISPVIACPADITVSMSAMCTPDTAGLAIATATDNCAGMLTFSYTDDVSGLTECSATGIILRTHTVVDACGNMDQCVQTITVVDDTPPVITCPADVTVYKIANTCNTDFAMAGMATATDNCSTAPTITFIDDETGLTECNQTGTINRIWTATDVCGNSSTCTQVITVADTVRPVISGVADLTVSCTDNAEALFDNWVTTFGGGSAFDNCTMPPALSTIPATPTFVENTEICVTFVATDACGLVSSQEACFNMHCIEIDKPAPAHADVDMSGDISAGDILTYTITASNTGSTTLNNVTVIDNLITPDTEVCTTLASGADCVLTGSYTVGPGDVLNGVIVNEATVTSDEVVDMSDDETVMLNAPDAVLVKTFVENTDPDMSEDISVGDVLNYRIVLYNTGDANLTDATITDDLITPSMASQMLLVAGDSLVLTGSYTVDAGDVTAGQIENLATANTDQTNPITDQVVLSVSEPSMVIDKAIPTLKIDNDANGEMSAGDVIEYVVTVTNDGTANLTDIMINDPKLSPASMSCAGPIAPGATCVLIGEYTITPMDITAGEIMNTATAISDQTPMIMDEVTQSLNQPSMSIVKSQPTLTDNDMNGEVSQNDVLNYTITVTNTGTATLTDVFINDDLITPATTMCATLAPGATCVLMGSYTVQASDVNNEISNTATADSDQTDPIMDQVSTTVPEPSMIVSKSDAVLTTDADGSEDMSVGDMITYTITLTNNGNANLPNVMITDPLLTPSVENCGLLEPGQSCQLVGTYEITDADVAAGEIQNVATGSSTIVPPVMDADTVVTPLSMPLMGIEKSAATITTDTDMSTDVSAGDVISYTITLTNTGTANLTNVTVSDPLLSPDEMVCAILYPGETCVLTGEYTVLPADVARGTITNKATATSDQAKMVMDEVVTNIPQPAKTIEKSYLSNDDGDGSGDISVGDELTYQVLVENTGTAYLTDVVITDSKITPSTISCASVAPGAQCILTGTYTVVPGDVLAGSISNTATADSDQTNLISDDVKIPLKMPAMVLEKTLINNADGDGSLDYSEGDVLTYEVILTNTGSANLTDVIVTDPLLSPDEMSCAVVAPGETCVLTGTYTISAADVTAGSFTNEASAVSDQLTMITDDYMIAIPQPALVINKAAPLLYHADNDFSKDMSAGDAIDYTITVTNTGTSNLTNVTINDPLFHHGGTETCPLLMPEETCVLTGHYMITEADVMNGGINNTATVTSDQTEADQDSVYQPLPQPDKTVSKNLLRYDDNDGSQDISVGDLLYYEVVLSNTGTANLTDVTIVDDLLTPDSTYCFRIEPGETCILMGTYQVVTDDIDMVITNTATGDSDQTDPMESDISVEIPQPSINLVKTPASLLADVDGSRDMSVGDTIRYVITALNNGNANLPDVVISDPLLTPSQNDCGLMLPGQTCQLVGTYVITEADLMTGSIENISTVSSSIVPPVMDADTSVTNLAQPSISMIKNPPMLLADMDMSGDMSAGDTISYVITAINNGTANLTNIVISDPLLTPMTQTCPLMEPSDECSLRAKYVITEDDVIRGRIDNTATTNTDQTDEIEDDATIALAQPSLDIEKSLNGYADVDGSGDYSVNDVLNYEIVVTNNGTANLTDVVITDDLITPSMMSCTIIAPGETCVLRGEYSITQDDIDAGIIENVATTDSDQTDPLQDDVDVPLPTPLMDIEKSLIANADGDGSGDISVGDVLTYQIVVTNIGTANLTQILVSDDLISPASTTCAFLAPAGECILIGTYTVTSTDLSTGSIFNEATGTSVQAPEVMDDLTVALPVPAYTINKSPATLSIDNDASMDMSEGDIIEYTITVENTGQATLTDVVVEDVSLPLMPSSNTCAVLDPGETCVLVGTYEIAATDLTNGSIDNMATVSSTQLPALSDEVSVELPQPAISIVKSNPTLIDVDMNGQVSLDDTLRYQVIVTNSGTANLTNVTITDDLITIDGGDAPCTFLAPMERCTLSGYYLVPGNGIEFTNIATANSDQVGPVVDSVSINVQGASLSIVKSDPVIINDRDGSGDISAGDVIEYTINVLNNGGQNFSSASISDPRLTPSMEMCGDLMPGETCTLVGTYEVTDQDVIDGEIKNEALVVSTSPPFEATDSIVTTLPQPAKELVKSPAELIDNDQSGDASVGDALRYMITATNTGTAVLTQVNITDAMLTPDEEVCAVVAPGETCVLMGDYIIQPADLGTVVKNVAAVNTLQTPEEKDSTELPIPVPSMSIDKSIATLADDLDMNGIMTTGDSLQYTITVTNDGTANLTGVVVSDPLLTPSSATCDFLAVGESCILIGKLALSQLDMDSAYITNIATATSVQAPEVMDTVTTDLPYLPAIELQKMADLPTIELGSESAFTDAGDQIRYSYTVENTGTATVYDIAITDAGPTMLGHMGTGTLSTIFCAETSLAPGESTVCEAYYTLTYDDVVRVAGLDDAVKNIATASSVGSLGDDVDADMSMATTTVQEYPAIELQKTAVTPLEDTNGDGIIWIDDEIQYVFTVTNVGNTTLNDINIEDSKLINPVECIADKLLPGESTQCTSSYVITDRDVGDLTILNSATAFGTSPISTLVSDISDDPTDPTTATDDPTVVELPCPTLTCIASVNISLPPSGILMLTSEDLGYVPGLLLRISVDGVELPDNTLTCEHAGMTLTYEIIHPCSEVGCWGDLNVETKNLPPTIYTRTDLMCIEERPERMSTDSVLAAIDVLGCWVDIHDVYVSETLAIAECAPDTVIRKVYGEYELKDGKESILLQVDTQYIHKLDTAMINAPKEEVIIDCKYLDYDPTPAFIDSIMGVTCAYPYVDKGIVVDSILRDTLVYRDSMRQEKVEISEGLWTLIDVIVHYYVDSSYYVYDTASGAVAIREGNTCNISVKYQDQKLESCLGTDTKILREWTIIDWCTKATMTASQWVVFKDSVGPSFELLKDQVAEIQPWTCSVLYQLYLTDLTDHCSAISSTDWGSSAGRITDDHYLTDVGVADSTVMVWVAVTDECDNVTRDTFSLRVIDATPPVAIALDTAHVTLTADTYHVGTAKVLAEDLDQGSNDAGCGKLTSCVLLQEEYESPIIRDGKQLINEKGEYLYTPAQCEAHGVYEYEYLVGKDTLIEEIPYVTCAPYVKFCCDDLGDHKVALIVDDESAYSASAVSWSIVTVEDKSTPLVYCEDILLNCGDDYSVAVVGYPEWYTSICGDEILTYEDRRDPSQCAMTTIERDWYVDAEYQCTQYIRFKEVRGFNPYTIKWPRHLNDDSYGGVQRECVDGLIYEENTLIDMGSSMTCEGDEITEPVWCEPSCSLVGLSKEDIETASSDACRQIIRRWTLIDWCTYEANTDNQGKDYDELQAVDDTWLGAGDWAAELIAGDSCMVCDHPSGLLDPIYFRYSEVDMDGYYTYDQIILIQDDTAPEIEVADTLIVPIYAGRESKGDEPTLCVASGSIIARAADSCGDIELIDESLSWWIELDMDGETIQTVSVVGDSAEIELPAFGSGAELTVRWQVSDGCGNIASDITQIIYEDKKNPTPVCIQDVSTALMSDGTVTLWAEDFDLGSFDNCSEVRFGFLPEGADDYQSTLTLTCGDLLYGPDTLEFELYVFDDYDNIDYCIVSVRLVDTDELCEEEEQPEEIGIGGIAISRMKELMPNVKINTNQSGKFDITDAEGRYAFSDLDPDLSATITATKADEVTNGLSVMDILLIQQHILGRSEITDAYEYLAADFNEDQRVTSQDIIQLRRVILGMDTQLPAGREWLFLPTDVAMELPEVYPLIESYSLVPAEVGSQIALDFIGVRIGDLDGNATVDPNKSAEYEYEGRAQLETDITQIELLDGYLRMPIFSSTNLAVHGAQLSIQLPHTNEVKLVSGEWKIAEQDYSLDKSQQLLRFIYTEQEVSEVSKEKPLFYIQMAQRGDDWLDQISSIVLTQGEMPSQWVAADMTLLKVNQNIKLRDSGELVLYQNEPNPFQEETTIRFYMPQAGKANLTLFDVNGRTLYDQTAEYSAGIQSVRLLADEIGQRGVIYYRLTAHDDVITKKLISMK